MLPFFRRRRPSLEARMRRDWDRRARENYRYYIAHQGWETEEAFAESGERDLEVILSDLTAFISPQAAVLEIGCGAGRLLEPLARRFRMVYGVDVSPEMIRRAKQRLRGCRNVKVWTNNGRDLKPLRSGTINLVISHIVFQHIPDPGVIASYIKEAYRVLKPGGLFKFQVCGREDTPEAEIDERTRPKDTMYGVRFTQQEIGEITAAAGFQLLSTYVRKQIQYLWTIAQKPGGTVARRP